MVARTMNKGNKQVTKAVAQKRMTEKAFRAEKAAKIWDQHPLFEGKLSGLTEDERQKTAIRLTNQARFMKTLTESETSTEFNRMAPANVMRLVQMTMTNLNRGNVFNEFAMETARDAIYYIKPYLSKPFSGNETFANRSDSFDGDMSADPYGFKGGINSSNNYIERNSRRTIYETTEDRFANELANGAESGSGPFTVTFKDSVFGAEGENYVPGYAVVYANHNPHNVIAFEDSTTYDLYIAPEYSVAFDVAKDDSNKVITVTKKETSGIEDEAEKAAIEKIQAEVKAVSAFARFASENDTDGDTMGEVNLLMSVFELRPHRTSIGVSWTKLAEITLGASFNTQCDDILLASAADVIHAQMDYRAFKEAYQLARTNPTNYTVTFNAAYTGTEKVGDSNATTFAKDSYVDNAQTFSSAIDIASTAVYEDRKRGAINKLVVGVDVAPYLKLNAGFSPKGLQEPCGVYKIGELDGIDVFKAPTEVLPKNEVLCVYKNNKVENDVAITYGTLVPFVSARLDYPTMYSRAGLATYGDRAILNRNYLARIVVVGLKDTYGSVKIGEIKQGRTMANIVTGVDGEAPVNGGRI